MGMKSGVFRAFGALVLAAALAACGGGADPVFEVQTVPVTVQVTNINGEPFTGANVRLTGSGVDQRGRTTDAEGQVRFDGVPKGRRIDVCGSAAGVRWGEVCQSLDWTGVAATATSTLVLYRYADATPVVLGVRSTPGNEGRTLSVEVDVAVLGENGAAIETLTGTDMAFYSEMFNEWGYCSPVVRDTTGADVYPCPVARARSFDLVPAQTRSAGATAVLLDQSERMTTFDPTGIRLGAVNTYFDSIAAPDTVALASYRGVAESHELTIHGGFTSDGAGLRSAVSALAGREGGAYALNGALAETISFTAANARGGTTDPLRYVVALTPRWGDGSVCSAWTLLACSQTSLAIAEAKRHGIAVVAIEPWPGAASAVAQLTGGAFVVAADPTQLPAVFRGLGAIVGRSQAFNRLKVEFDGEAGMFLPGRVLSASLRVRVGQGIYIDLPLQVPI